MKSILHILIYSLLFLLLCTKGAFSEDILSGGHEDGERLLEEKQYSQAEKLATSLLSNNPSDPKAEFILTRAWIGLGRDEVKNGNIDRGKQFLQKAYLKWPLNQELKSEIETISKKANQRSITQTSFGKSTGASSNTIILLDSEIYRSIEEIKAALNSILSQTRTFNRENEQAASKERFYQTALICLTIFSTLNLILTIFILRKK
ncbi:tetratricopeptide repeat protein [Leptospira yasudae]|uniref:tetratricopeptide repeat protein n=1 Tax=Leptospira yasudae TaxID=2202201 RepID=UPI001C4F5E89|nr:tetratricopeptide repeat protein [Leptospira yasudae]MBW0434987.1 tetratricopeptide repeat protein [Leptospira yasudae]